MRAAFFHAPYQNRPQRMGGNLVKPEDAIGVILSLAVLAVISVAALVAVVAIEARSEVRAEVARLGK